MKKTLLLTLSAAALMTTAEARQWNFSSWSAETQDNIVADAKWTSDEKGNGTEFAGCYWYKASSVADACDADSNLVANGVTIKELQGLKVSAYGSGWVAIGTDYQVTKDANAWGPYNGAQYLWLANKGLRLIIPAVAPGTTITAGLESHKPSDARGIDLYVNGTAIAKEPSAYPTTYADYTWVVPEDIDAETVDVEIRPSNGCHLYYINVDEGDGGYDATSAKVAYVFDGTYNGAKDAAKNPIGWLANGGLDSDPIYNALQSFDVTPIDVNGQTLTTTELNDSLLNFDVVVLGEAVSSGNSYAKSLVDIINKVPMLNLKSFMYKSGVWSVGAGSNPSPKATTVKINEDYLDHPLFADLESLDDEGNITLFDCDDVTAVPGGNLVQGYTTSAGSLFENDEVLATVGDGINAIHVHGTKNQYMLIPISSDNMDLAAGDLSMLVYNAITVLAPTKSKVQNAAAPVITQVAGNGITNVSISCTTAGATIYYTLDGTEPTEASPVYAEAFDVTTDSIVVKAFATAHGYNPSSVATAVISVKAQAAAPTIQAVQSEGYTTITLAGDEGDMLYFSFNGIKTVAGSQLYTEPVVITEPATITALAASNTKLASDIATLDIAVAGIPAVKDTVAHFTANEEDWFTNAVIKDYDMTELPTPESNWAAKAAYYFGKNAWAYYGTEIESEETVTGSEGQDSVVYHYKADPTAVKYVYSNTDTQWRLRSQGQALTGETNVAATYTIGGPDLVGYYAESAKDLIGQPSKGKLTFGGKGSGEPYTASIESTVKFTAPFDVVTYMTNGNTSAVGIVLQTSVDGENWATADTLTSATTQRYYTKDRFHIGAEAGEVYVRVAQTFGGSKAQVYDIYVITTEGKTGIETLAADRENRQTVLFDLQGRQVAAPVRGHLYIQNGKKFIVK